MIERFQGDTGKRLLAEALADQRIVNGSAEIAGALLAVVQLRELAPGEVLIRQDGDDNDLFFVISGSLNVEANGRVVAVRTAGTHVGEMALIDSKACRCATVRASERTVVANVLEADFSRIADEYPTLWRRIAVELCDRLRNRNRMIFPPNEVPQIFICSSTESLPVAERIQLGLDHHASVARVWTDQVFGPMKQTMEDLEREVRAADFAVAVVTGDDLVTSRRRQSRAPRDNVVFELGLFMGQLGRERTIIVSPRGINLKLPSDLLGLTPLTFSPPTDWADVRQLAVSLGPVCTQLKTLIDQLGPR